MNLNSKSFIDLSERFKDRHISSNLATQNKMLSQLGYADLEALIDDTIPAHIRKKEKLNLPDAIGEQEFIEHFVKVSRKNKLFRNYIGQGFYPAYMPSVILRNVFENPGWYTPYTPYQAEIAQGRLEALINFQTMITEITGMDIANASMLDESSAAAEAMIMLYRNRKKKKLKADTIFIDQHVFPQTYAVLKNRALPLGIKIEKGDWTNIQNYDVDQYFAVLIQFPNVNGEIENDYIQKVTAWRQHDVKVVIAADLFSLTLYTPPGEFDADVVLGSTQRFGIPLGYGGPHAAYFAFKEEYKRVAPGRIIGTSVDTCGKTTYRMALQTREQHIRREKATSNICTAQAFLATLASFYAVYHGKKGILKITQRIYQLTCWLKQGIEMLGYSSSNKIFFDTITLYVNDQDKEMIREQAEDQSINLRYAKGSVSISFDETTTVDDLNTLLTLLDIHNTTYKEVIPTTLMNLQRVSYKELIPKEIQRKSDFMSHATFNKYRSEHELLRYMKQLERKDIGLTDSMISLGSCTMKLNAATEMIPLSWRHWSAIHPYAPKSQTWGYREVIETLGAWLNEITGFEATSFQPNSGAQGEYAGLSIINEYHQSRGHGYRNTVLIPQSAHGTNPASAIMCGLKVVEVACTEKGGICLDDLKKKLATHGEQLSAFMVTYPSTRGVFDQEIVTICQWVHDYGGQVYMDGANMNAQIGLTSPAIIGADVCHLNLHKTFAIPHGGGGPGMGPICCAKHLVPFLPTSKVESTAEDTDMKGIFWASAHHSSASILAISYAYIAMMGAEGLLEATKVAILNANYIKHRLSVAYDICFTGEKDNVAHELIIDCRAFKKKNILVEDIAKRLIDYGFHAPTVSFPVAGTLMIEPTESENLEEIDRFCDALISIRKEINEIEINNDGNNLLKNAPHTAQSIAATEWNHPYTRMQAAYPLPYLELNKYWSPVARIDSAYGDRNLSCCCPM